MILSWPIPLRDIDPQAVQYLCKALARNVSDITFAPGCLGNMCKTEIPRG